MLDIKYARLKRTHLKDQHIKFYGFILMGRAHHLSFFHTDKSEIDRWIEALKSSVILIDLQKDFELGKVLGQGNFARVHAAVRRGDETKTTVAIKSMKIKTIQQSRRQINYVLSEIDILRTVNSPNVIKLYEVYQCEKYIHLVLQYLDGGELFKRLLSKKVYQENNAMQVMQIFLQALNTCHKMSIVHRDLKPENLILARQDNDTEIVIADFGLASFIQEGEVLKQVCGTPGYTAPEMLLNEGYTTKADVFSAGVVLYTLLTGVPVFRSEKGDYNELIKLNKECNVSFKEKAWSKVSENARELVQLMLEKDPAKRITCEEAL